MKLQTKTIILLLGLVLVAILAVWITRKNTAEPKPLLTLRLQEVQSATGTQLSFDVVNHGQSPIMCPDSWFLEFKDGTVRNLSLAPNGDVRVNPGATATVSIPRPTNTMPWRLGTHFYEEDLVFEAKVRVDRSPVKSVLPAGASRVQGKVAVGDWNDHGPEALLTHEKGPSQPADADAIDAIWKGLWDSDPKTGEPKTEPLTEKQVRDTMISKWTVTFGPTADTLSIVFGMDRRAEVFGKKGGQPWNKRGEWKVVSGKLVLLLEGENVPSFVFKKGSAHFIFDPWAEGQMSELRRENVK
jgi:hypothetical protein